MGFYAHFRLWPCVLPQHLVRRCVQPSRIVIDDLITIFDNAVMIDDSVNYTLRHIGPRWRTKVSFDPRSAITKAVSVVRCLVGPLASGINNTCTKPRVSGQNKARQRRQVVEPRSTKWGVNVDVPKGVLGSFFCTHSLDACSIVSIFTRPYFGVLAVYTHATACFYFMDYSCMDNDISE